ncbi:MAG: imidazolonepropionase [Candidatus Brocadiia bacterium]
MQFLDLLITNTGTVHTMTGPAFRRGVEMLDTSPLVGGVVGIRDGMIAFVGSRASLENSSFSIGPSTVQVDARGGDVIPGFVDSHTHTIWLGDRRRDFADLLKGVSYSEITARGGGINTTVRATRGATVEQLVEGATGRLQRMLDYGTTSVETKSGYALDTEGELRMLEAADRLRASTKQNLVITFLGAHLVPFDYKDRRGDYVRLVLDEMLPQVASQGHARFNDVFMEHNAFSSDETRAILSRGSDLGLRPRLHCDELSETGGAGLAVELGASSCDHLEYISDAGIAALADSHTVATLMPGTSFYLNLPRHAPFRKLYDAGCIIALATDFNPGTSPSLSMQGAFALAVLLLRMPIEVALCACTVNAAYSLGLENAVGTIEEGKRADIVVLKGSVSDMAYAWGENHCAHVICAGESAEHRRA